MSLEWVGARARVRASILMRVLPDDAGEVARSLASLRQQSPGWEIVIAAPPDSAESVRALAAAEIRVIELPLETGEAAAYERCSAEAVGDFLLLLAPGETLARGALASATRVLDAATDTAVVYADEDRIDAAGSHHTPFLRPDWSPTYLLSALYVDRAFVVRRAAVEAVGGFRSEYDPVPEGDLLLRLSEAGPFAHIREVLFHRPGERGSPWRAADPTAIAAGRRAVAAAWARRGIPTEVQSLCLAATYRSHRTRRTTGLVSLIVPFRDGAILLARCVRSILPNTEAIQFELILVDNDSVEPETTALLGELRDHPAIKIVAAPGPFNFSALVRRGVEASRGDVVCLVNSDVEALSPGWVGALLDEIERPEVGVAGARLLYPDGSVQHAGIALGLDGTTGHIGRFAPAADTGYFGSLAVVRDVSAVTGACLAMRRETFEGLGGFDEALPAAYNDVDFCLRAWDRGLLVVCTPFAELMHREGASRGRADAARDALALMRRRWGGRLEFDPYHRHRTGDDAARPPTGMLARTRTMLALQARRAHWLGRDVGRALGGVVATVAAMAADPRDGAQSSLRGRSAVRGATNNGIGGTVRVLHLVGSYPPGGDCAGRWCQGLSRALADRGLAVRVLTLDSSLEGSGVARRLELDAGVEVERFSMSEPLHLIRRMGPGWRTRGAEPWSGALRGAILRGVAAHEVVHIHGVTPPHGAWAANAARLAGRRVVYTPHLHGLETVTENVRGLARGADAVTIAHPDEAGWLRARDASPKRIVEAGDPGPVPGPVTGGPRALGLAEGERLLVFLGPPGWENGAMTFVDAVRLVLLAGHPAVAAIVGGGAEELMRRFWQTNLVKVIEIAAPDVDERRGLVAAADAAVLPDDWCAGMVAEGWASGTPVIAPGREGAATAQERLHTFGRGDPLGLARAILRVFERRDSYAPQAADPAGWPVVAQTIERMYAALLAVGAHTASQSCR
jgi:GT2 family glycosyltransferase/glycosyltransferase involved in cell wall biosynthesis